MSDNKAKNCPPRMSDGRHFTDYRPVCFLNNSMIVDNKISNSFDYRMHLIRNAEKLMNNNRAYISAKNGCDKDCMKPYNIGTMLPESSKVICDDKKCNVEVTDTNGLGQGRQYSKDGSKPCENWPENQ